MDSLEGDLSDTTPMGAINGYIRAVAESRHDWARYYLAPEATGPSGSTTPADSTMRVYYPPWDDAEIDQIDDSNGVVWTSLGFSIGRELKVQSVAFKCRKVDGVWKIGGVVEGPEVSVSVRENDISRSSAQKGGKAEDQSAP